MAECSVIFLEKGPPQPKRVIQLVGVLPTSAADSPMSSSATFQMSTSLSSYNQPATFSHTSSPEADLRTPKLEPVDLDCVKTEPEAARQLQESIGDLAIQGALVEHSLISLPSVVNEVAENQRDQTALLQQHKLCLGQAQVKLKTVEGRLTEIMSEMASVNRKCFLSEEDSANHKLMISQLSKDIDILITGCDAVRYELQCKQDDQKEKKKLYKEYEEKMMVHRAAVAEVESSCDIHMQLRKQAQIVQDLRNAKASIGSESESNSIASSKLEASAQENITKYKQNQLEIDSKISICNEQITKEKEKQGQLKQETEVLHKRNAAQLTRLRRQLKEIQSRNRQWSEQATHLDACVANFREQLASLDGK